MANTKADRFIFRKHATIGAADAIEDATFLFDTFLDNGEVRTLTDLSSPICLIMGRTGTGKTALLEMIRKREERVISIAPESLSLSYLSNRTSLSFYLAAGVNMDLFYRLLWRHVFTVEILKAHHKIQDEQAKNSFVTRLREKFKNSKPRTEGLDYLVNWGDSFWKESDYRIREVTTKLEQELNSTLQANLQATVPGYKAGVQLNAGMAHNLTEEQRAEIVQLGQSVVDKVQIKTLSEIMDILRDELEEDEQKKYFLTIDRLDETWVTEDLRYQLIRALIDTVRDFNKKIKNIKILLALRLDLIDRVFKYTRGPGYQEEKYRSMYLHLTWKASDLERLVNKRVDKLVKEQYTKNLVTLKDLLPEKIGKANPIKYFFDRTLLTPRDSITLFNFCIAAGEGKPKLNSTTLRKAETNHSLSRLRALADEWSSDYEDAIAFCKFIAEFPSIFTPLNEKERFEERMLEFLIASKTRDYLYFLVEEKFNSNDTDGFIEELLKILYKLGVIGLRQYKSEEWSWSFTNSYITPSDIDLKGKAKINAAFHSALSIAGPD